MVDYSKLPRSPILCVDMRSFYSSVEAVNRGLDPVNDYIAVVGDRSRSGSVVLAASPALKKQYGIRTGKRLYEIPADPDIHIFNARMGLYLDTSMAITRLLNTYAPAEAIHTYSVDESWVNLAGLEKLYGKPREIARSIQEQIMTQIGIPTSMGLGPNKFISKVIMDNIGKKVGIAECDYEDVPRLLWPLPVEDIWGIGRRMKRNLNMLGIFVLGDLAKFPLEKLKKKFGIMGEQLYYHAWGVDLSPVLVDPSDPIRKGFSNGITLLRDYTAHEVPTVIYELTDHIASRMRVIHTAARTVTLSLGYSKYEGIQSFSRSRTLPEATSLSKRLYEACMNIMRQANIQGRIRTVHVGVSNLVDDTAIQVDLFSGPADEQLRRLGSAMDSIQSRFGQAALFRASSLTSAGTHMGRSHKIGGHFQ